MSAAESDSDALIALYETHPCNADSVLKRVAVEGRLPRDLTSLDLATDPLGTRTDQNHVGDVAFVEALAAAAGVGDRSLVLDLGCGLGGSARLLASMFGCKVDGLDISPRRVREGNDLCRLVNLDDRVVLRCGDLRSHPVGGPRYTHLWSQGVWVHLSDKRNALERWLGALKPDGHIAIEDAYLRCEEVPQKSVASWRRLSEIWFATIPSLTGWRAIFEPELELEIADDVTPGLIAYFARLIEMAGRPATPQDQREVKAWRLAVELAQSGILGYLRLVARRSVG